MEAANDSGTLEKPESRSALPSHTLPGRSIEEDDVYSDGGQPDQNEDDAEQEEPDDKQQYNQDLEMDMDGDQSEEGANDEAEAGAADGMNGDMDGDQQHQMLDEDDMDGMDDYGDQVDMDVMVRGDAPADLNQEELEAIIESISTGKSQQYKKLQFQAFAAAISHEDQVRFVVDYLSNVSNPKSSSKFATAKNRILAYRVSQLDPVQQKDVLAEGFDDDGEDGSGEKLLTVLQKMDITNIMIVVCIWNSGVTIGDNRLRGGEFFRMITDRARELLTVIKQGVQQTELEEYKHGSDPAQNNNSPKMMRGLKVIRPANQNYDLLNVQKHPGMYSHTQRAIMGYTKQPEAAADKIDEQILALFKTGLSEQDMQEAQDEINEALSSLTKAAILELKTMTKPDILVEKTLKVVTSLRGFKHNNWNTAKELLGKPSFKVDLMQLSPKSMRAADVLAAQKILTQKTNTMLTPENVQFHSEGAALLLIWGANLIKLYACYKKLKPKEDIGVKKLNYEALQRITNKTRVQLKNAVLADNIETKESKKKAIQFKTTGLTSVTAIRTKPGNIGHFVQSKAAIFDSDQSTLKASLVDATKQKEKKLVDLSVLKKGLNFHGTTQANLDKEHGEMKREEERMEREHAVKQTSRSFKDDATSIKDDKSKATKKKDAAKDKVEEEAQEGVLKMVQVQNLPEDVEMIVGQLKTLDFTKQDLDVLIELSKQLKYKRLSLFPDTAYMQTLHNAGLTPEQIMKEQNSKKENKGKLGQLPTTTTGND